MRFSEIFYFAYLLLVDTTRCINLSRIWSKNKSLCYISKIKTICIFLEHCHTFLLRIKEFHVVKKIKSGSTPFDIIIDITLDMLLLSDNIAVLWPFDLFVRSVSGKAATKLQVQVQDCRMARANNQVLRDFRRLDAGISARAGQDSYAAAEWHLDDKHEQYG